MTLPTLQLIPIDKLQSRTDRIRKSSCREGLVRLAASIESEGQQTPIHVHAIGEDGEPRYLIDQGDRLARAMELSGAKEILGLVYPESPTRWRLKCLAANVAKEDVPPLDLADAIEAAIAEDFVSAAEVARCIAWSEGQVSKLRTVRRDLDPEVQQLIADGSLPWSAGYELTRIKDPERQRVAAMEAVSRDLSRDEVAGKVRGAERRGRGKRMVVPICNGCSMAIVSRSLSLSVVIENVAAILDKARQAQASGGGLQAFVASLRKAKVAKAGVA